MTSLVPSLRWLIASDLITSSVIMPPALRSRCASASAMPSADRTRNRVSMQVTTATCLDGRTSRPPTWVGA
jgi:hypothetical protein